MMQPLRQSDCYLVFGSSPAIAGFPIAVSLERQEEQGWLALHLLVWYVAIAWHCQGAAEGGAA
jgi:hypothetical protein